MFVSSNGHTGRQRRLGKDVGERTDQEVEMGTFCCVPENKSQEPYVLPSR